MQHKILVFAQNLECYIDTLDFIGSVRFRQCSLEVFSQSWLVFMAGFRNILSSLSDSDPEKKCAYQKSNPAVFFVFFKFVGGSDRNCFVL